MNILDRIRNGEDGTIVHGLHAAIIQSVLDFDFLSCKSKPSILAILASNRKSQKFFFGRQEILLPCFKNIEALPKEMESQVKWLLNLQSGRRAFDSTVQFFSAFPQALGAHIFAENVPESHATTLIKMYGGKYVIAGPSGVGLLVTSKIKLGAVGGTTVSQILSGKLTSPGSLAVISTSGGMTNELITQAAKVGKGTSFAIAIGGDRFPVTSLTEAFLLAESDIQTEAVLYFGELGGEDEYEIVSLIEKKKFTKPILAYIAGVIDEEFKEPMQFGHAKALVLKKDESARAKREALMKVGVIVPETFSELLQNIKELPGDDLYATTPDMSLSERQKSILSTREIVSADSSSMFIKDGKLLSRGDFAFAHTTMHALLGKSVEKTTAAFVENVFELLIDHGGNVSGAVNTMITARAGKDLVSSLASGLLTIGPRFGGAINDAASAWNEGVTNGATAEEFVESKTKAGMLLSGIGHLKYRVGLPDPRVQALSEFAPLIRNHPHYDFAREVERVTTSKNGSLILNVDGVVAALMLDLLIECEHMNSAELKELIDAEFFNAMFIIPRSVGFIAHFMEQKKNDEGLFRLPDELLFVKKKKE